MDKSINNQTGCLEIIPNGARLSKNTNKNDKIPNLVLHARWCKPFPYNSSIKIIFFFSGFSLNQGITLFFFSADPPEGEPKRKSYPCLKELIIRKEI